MGSHLVGGNGILKQRALNVDSATRGDLTVANHCVISRNIWSSTFARTARTGEATVCNVQWYWNLRVVSIIGMFLTNSHCFQRKTVAACR
jgi:hypothetical protein